MVGRLVDEKFHGEYGSTAGGITAALRRELKKPRPTLNRLHPDWGDK
jgi:hypothetical protein